jgi:hypothetical protein
VGGFLVALLVGSLAQPAAAPPVELPVDVSWEAPRGCPDAARILGEIARLLASTEPGPHRKRVRASAQPRRTADGGWRLQLVIRDDSGETARRTLADRSCAVIADATALIVAIAVDPTIQTTGAPAAAPAAPAPPAPARAEPAPATAIAADLSVERPAAAPALRRATRTRYAAGVFGTGRTGVLPGVDGGAGLSLAGIAGRWRLELAAGYVFPGDVTLASNPGAGARLWQWWLALAPCRVADWRRFEFLLCAGVEGGALHGRGIGDTVAPTDGRQPWLALAAGAGAIWLVGDNVGVRLAAAAALAVLRPAFDLGSEAVHRTGVLSGRMTLGAEWRF